MGIRRRYAEREVARALLGAVEARRRGLARGLCAVGEMAVAQARTHGSYRDRTGNLRASVGYAVARDGRPVGPGDLGEGLPGAGNPGRAAALRAVRGYPRGASLVVAAGMRYAAYVSALGYDVLESAELLARARARALVARGLGEMGETGSGNG